MKSLRLLVLAALTGSSQVCAIRVADAPAPAPSAVAVRQAEKPGDGATHAGDGSSMREGVVTGINDRRDEIEVNGSWLKLADGTTRIFRRGFGATRDDLAHGQKVRFTLAPGANDRLTLGAVYVP
jgi:hypothetical protein